MIAQPITIEKGRLRAAFYLTDFSFRDQRAASHMRPAPHPNPLPACRERGRALLDLREERNGNVAACVLLPRPRGEGAGRRMRGRRQTRSFSKSWITEPSPTNKRPPEISERPFISQTLRKPYSAAGGPCLDPPPFVARKPSPPATASSINGFDFIRSGNAETAAVIARAR